jgi:hypothetical protein
MGAAAIIQGIGGVSSMRQSEYAAETAENMAEWNAKVAEIAAVDAEQQGEVEASRIRSKGVMEMSKARATMLAGGMDAASAGLLDMMEGMAINIETDAETARNNAARQAWGLRNQMTTSIYEGQAAADRLRAQGTGDLLTGVGRAVDAYGRSRSGSSNNSSDSSSGMDEG